MVFVIVGVILAIVGPLYLRAHIATSRRNARAETRRILARLREGVVVTHEGAEGPEALGTPHAPPSGSDARETKSVSRASNT